MGNNTDLQRWEQRLISYGKALNRLGEVVNENKKRKLNDFERDSIVKRFEFTFECAWHLMKSYAESQGVENVGASRDSIRQALRLNTIVEGETWMNMIKWRNETSHNYDGVIAETVLNNVCNVFYPVMVDYYYTMRKFSDNIQQDLF